MIWVCPSRTTRTSEARQPALEPGPALADPQVGMVEGGHPQPDERSAGDRLRKVAVGKEFRRAMLVETAGTVNTGDAGGNKTAPADAWI